MHRDGNKDNARTQSKQNRSENLKKAADRAPEKTQPDKPAAPEHAPKTRRQTLRRLRGPALPPLAGNRTDSANSWMSWLRLKSSSTTYDRSSIC